MAKSLLISQTITTKLKSPQSALDRAVCVCVGGGDGVRWLRGQVKRTRKQNLYPPEAKTLRQQVTEEAKKRSHVSWSAIWHRTDWETRWSPIGDFGDAWRERNRHWGTPHEIPCLIKGAMGNDGNIYFAGVGWAAWEKKSSGQHCHMAL